jgi:glycine/D-amino acid oxidase-like deaminating enzyme
LKSIQEVLDTPVMAEVDVLVCGGGMTGFPAAIAAARNGAKTMLVEAEGSLGGTATAGLMCGYTPYFNDGEGNRVVGGIIYEFTERLDAEDALPLKAFTPTEGFCKLQFDPEILKRVAMDMTREAGVEVLLHSQVGSPLMEGQRVVGATFEGRRGRFGVLAGATVDATGDGSMAAWAGAPFEEATGNTSTLMYMICNIDLDATARAMASRLDPRRAEELLKWYRAHGTLSVVIQSDFPDVYEEAVASGDFPADAKTREDGFDMQGVHGLARKGFAYVFGPYVRGSCLEPRETSRMEADAAERVWQQMKLVRRVPGLENASVVQVAPSLGVRASRHVECEYQISHGDTLEGAKFPDAVGQGCKFVPWLPDRREFRGRVFQIPFRALLPLQVEGLLIGGRAISNGNVRNMVSCAVAGQACGTAAALSSSAGVGPRELPVPALQGTLGRQGVILPGT